MKRTLIHNIIGFLALVAITAGSVLVCAFNEPMPPSLYKPELQREMTQEQRWQLDAELANAISMRFSAYRLDVTDDLEPRALWLEQQAVSYRLADLIQQILDLRAGNAHGNEAAFNQLVDLGRQGDAGASCIAALLYQYHPRDDTRRWKYSREEAAWLAQKAKAASEHPVCTRLASQPHGLDEKG